MKKGFLRITAILMIAVAFHVCKKSDDGNEDTILTALLYVADLSSGNCATITKNSSTLYNVVLTSVPKGGCNQATLAGSDLAGRAALINANFDAYSALATSLNCSVATTNLITSAKNTAIAANTQAAFDNLVATTKYVPIQDLRVEGAPVVTKSAFGIALGLADSDVLSWKLLTVDQNKSAQNLINLRTFAAGAGDVACINAITNKVDTDFKGFVGLDSSATTKATISGVAQITCQYGTSAVVANKCATLNTEF
ncbi:hypothetical protein [Leptospira stimsonii]|uniref:Lipoprotein n=1 Tax=Leptospira stimsonii TaxID=2202203 RepID=A0ABY2MWE2_9LEPT|nr:hypothetical protein [Leptospira stimsonii]TGK23912.1 hypothetical protein EHO98_04430 [Leptospira stimsonii]TGM10380.1 hypothetical protein EHQ90_18090 [Leptospira stimsonii]